MKMVGKVKHHENKLNPAELPSAWETLDKLKSELTTWQKIVCWFYADFLYWLDDLFYRITGKWLLK